MIVLVFPRVGAFLGARFSGSKKGVSLWQTARTEPHIPKGLVSVPSKGVFPWTGPNGCLAYKELVPALLVGFKGSPKDNRDKAPFSDLPMPKENQETYRFWGRGVKIALLFFTILRFLKKTEQSPFLEAPSLLKTAPPSGRRRGAAPAVPRRGAGAVRGRGPGGAAVSAGPDLRASEAKDAESKPTHGQFGPFIMVVVGKHFTFLLIVV